MKTKQNQSVSRNDLQNTEVCVNGLQPWNGGYKHQPASAAKIGQYKIIGCWMSRITAVKHNRKTTVIQTAFGVGVKYPAQCDVPVAAEVL